MLFSKISFTWTQNFVKEAFERESEILLTLFLLNAH